MLDEGALGMGYRSLKRLHGGCFRKGFFTREPERWGFWETCKCPVDGPPSLLGPFWGTWRGFVCRDFWEKWILYLSTFVNSEVTWVLSLSETLTSLRHTYLGSFFFFFFFFFLFFFSFFSFFSFFFLFSFLFFYREDNRKLSIRDIWSLVEGTGLS